MNRRGISIRARFLALLLVVFLVLSDNSLSVLASGISQLNENRTATSSEEGEETPSDEDEETPSDEDEETPSDEGEETPSDEGEETPSDEDEETPSDEGEETPSDEDEETPSDEGEETPSEEDSAEEEASPQLLKGRVAAYAASDAGTTALYIQESGGEEAKRR